jgi:hypothetical protein
LVEIGRAGRYLYSHDEPFSALTSPLNHAGRDFRRHSGSRSAKSVSSPCGLTGTGPGSHVGLPTARGESASPGKYLLVFAMNWYIKEENCVILDDDGGTNQ